MSESPPLSRRKRETTDARKPEEGPENQPHNHKMDDAAAFACSWCAMLLVRSVVLLRAKRLRFGQWIRGSSSGACGGAAMAACCAVLLVPTSRVGFAVATGLSAAFQWASLPHQLDNSGFFALLTNVQLLAARGDARLVASGVRRVFVIMYAAAAFAKLNDGFVDERRGATTVFVVHSLEAWVPSWLKRRIVLGRNTKNNTATSSSADAAVLKWLGRTAAVVLATEVAIPVTLVAVPTVGARLAWAFHVVLCATAFDFSVTAVATLPLFYLSMSRGDYAAAVAWCFGSVATRLLVVFAFLAMVFPVGRARTAATKSAVATSPWGGSSTQAAAAVLVVALYPGAWARHRSPVPLLSWNVPSAALRLGDDDDDASTPRSRDDASPLDSLCWVSAAATAACTVVAVVNAAAPYVGLRTHGTWSMFSNLRVEGGRTNHWLVPARVGRFGYCAEDVTVLATNADAVRWHHTRDATFAAAPPQKKDDGAGSFNKDHHSTTTKGGGGGGGLELFAGLARRRGLATVIHSNSPLGGSESSGAQPVLPSAMPFLQLRHLCSGLVDTTTTATSAARDSKKKKKKADTKAPGGGFFVEYLENSHGGRRRRFEVDAQGNLVGTSNDPRLAVRPNLLQRKLCYFRATPPDERSACAI